jgi:hypothetical protein
LAIWSGERSGRELARAPTPELAKNRDVKIKGLKVELIKYVIYPHTIANLGPY